METGPLPAGKSRMSRFSRFSMNNDGVGVFNFAENVIIEISWQAVKSP